MDCTEFLERYSEYDDSLIPPAQSERFRAHMSECPACTRYDRVLRKGRMLARQVPVVEPSDAFVPRLHMRLGGAPAPGTQRREWTGGPWRVASGPPAMALLMALIAAAALASPEARGGGGEPSSGLASGDPSRAAAPVTGTWLNDHRASGAARGLPRSVLAAGPAEARPWGSERVDRTASSSYSPLVMGPPAYRAGPPRMRVSLSTHPKLD
jgi:anti-sigma factor RsiW